MNDIIIKPSISAEMPIPAIKVYPHAGDLEMRCGNCASMRFRIHVKRNSIKVGGCRITEFVCDVCYKYIQVDMHGIVQGHGKSRKYTKKERQLGLNGTKRKLETSL